MTILGSAEFAEASFLDKYFSMIRSARCRDMRNRSRFSAKSCRKWDKRSCVRIETCEPAGCGMKEESAASHEPEQGMKQQGWRIEPRLFWSWASWKRQHRQILINVAMFVPVGLLTGKMWKWKGLAVAAGMSICVELLQLLTSRGLCEFDDMMHNMIGAAIGTGIVMFGQWILERRNKPEQ